MKVVWSYQHIVRQTVEDEENGEINFSNLKVPGFLHQDPNDVSKMYMIGQFNYKGSMIKFSKKNMNIDWKVEIGHPNPPVASDSARPETDSLMHEILSYVQPKDTNNIYGCGYYKVNSL